MANTDPAADLRQVVQQLVGSMEALAALGVILGTKAGAPTPSPQVVAQIDAVARALGVDDVIDQIDTDTARALHGLVRTTLMQSVDFVERPDREGTWVYDDPAVLQATGAVSAIFAPVIRATVVPELAGLPERLESPDAAFLDVGVGVAALAIAVANAFPQMQVTGIDIWEPALTLARANIDAADLSGRVTVRKQDVRELDDDAAYDLVWLAVPFLSPAIVPEALDRCARSLRPGGWLLFARFGGVDPLTTALSDLRALRAGGAAWSDDDALRLLADAGLTEGQHVTLDPGVPGRITVGRR